MCSPFVLLRSQVYVGLCMPTEQLCASEVRVANGSWHETADDYNFVSCTISPCRGARLVADNELVSLICKQTMYGVFFFLKDTGDKLDLALALALVATKIGPLIFANKK